MHLATLACLQAHHSNILQQITQIRPNDIKNSYPNWQKVTSWLFSSMGGIWFWNPVAGGLKPRTASLWVQHGDHLAMLSPPCNWIGDQVFSKDSAVLIKLLFLTYFVPFQKEQEQSPQAMTDWLTRDCRVNDWQEWQTDSPTYPHNNWAPFHSRSIIMPRLCQHHLIINTPW